MRRLLLHKDHIVAGLCAGDREDALKQLVDALPAASLRGIRRSKILDLLLLREDLGTTAIGQGIALPHCFSPEIHEPVVAFGVSPDGIPYPALDECPVHFIFLLILPQSEAAELRKRQILQNVKWFLCDRYMQERLKAARTALEIHQLIHAEVQPVQKAGISQVLVDV